MTSISIIDLFTIVFVLVDDGYRKESSNSQPGTKAEFLDSEVITLMLMQEFLHIPSESQYISILVTSWSPSAP